jgi:hypothetical protein
MKARYISVAPFFCSLLLLAVSVAAQDLGPGFTRSLLHATAQTRDRDGEPGQISRGDEERTKNA